MPQGPASRASGRIFISIAAFRDPETRWTVRDLLQKASQPDRLAIAIVWQVDTASEADLMDLPICASQKRQVESSPQDLCISQMLVGHTRLLPILCL